MERLQRPGAQQRGGGSVPGGRRCRYRHWQPLHHCRHSEHGSSPPGPDNLQSDHRHPDQQLVPSIQRPSATPPTGAPTAHWSARREGPCRGPDCLLMSRATNWRRTPGWASRLASGLHGDVRRRPVRCSREAAREGGFFRGFFRSCWLGFRASLPSHPIRGSAEASLGFSPHLASFGVLLYQVHENPRDESIFLCGCSF